MMCVVKCVVEPKSRSFLYSGDGTDLPKKNSYKNGETVLLAGPRQCGANKVS